VELAQRRTKADPRLGTAVKAAAENGVSVRTIRRWVKHGDATGHLVLGGRLLIDLDTITRKRYQRRRREQQA
jgi:predicted site-specific integrase-resolvase